jgi:hypothetical protein
MRLGHIDQVLAAEGCYFNTPVQTQKPLFYGSLQDEIRAAVGPENARHRAVRTILWLPGRRTGIAVNQAAGLFITAPMIVLIIKAAFLPGWINHNNFLSLVRMIGKDGGSVKTIEEYPRREGKRYIIHAAFTK